MKKIKRKWYQTLYPFYIFLGLVVAYSLCSSTDHDRDIRSKVVRVLGAQGMCSGEQVKAASGKDYILTASHCIHLGENGVYKVKDERGAIHYLHLIAEDPNSDLLLLDGIPGMEGLPVANRVGRFQHIETFTHPRNFDTLKTEGVMMEQHEESIPLFEVYDQATKDKCLSMPKLRFYPNFGDTQGTCAYVTNFQFSTAFISPGSSGGAVVNKAGELVGVVSAGGAGFALFVTLDDIKSFLKDY